MSQVSKEDLLAIKEWLAKESSLPKTFDDNALRKFIFSCHCSLERTKKCIEEFCTRRANMPEIYTNRDPMSKKLQLVYANTKVITLRIGEDELLLHQITEVPSNFDFYDFLKAFTIQADNWINMKTDVLPENHIVVLDIKQYSLAMVAKSNMFYFQKFIMFLLESMPVRLKNVHVINCPPFYEYLYNLVKSAIPENVINMIQFHQGHMGLHQYIDKKYLPKELDGDNTSIAELNEALTGLLSDNRKTFLDDDLWKADLSKRPKDKDSQVENNMNGSFRKLVID